MNWFVAEGASGGDGSREKPFHDPWLALRAAGPGDFIHITAGTYFGQYDRSSWVIDSPKLTILGGYTKDFSKRTPWQAPSIFASYPNYEATRENNLITGRDNHEGLVLDGLYFDNAGRNRYDEKTDGLRDHPNMDGPIAAFNAKHVTIKNCVFANGTSGGVQLSGDGSRFENNFVINIIGLGMLELRDAPSNQTQLITAANNTFCFAHDTSGPPFGMGADNAIGIRSRCPALIQNNLFIGCGNAAISIYAELERTSVDGNLFYLTPRAVLASRAQVSASEILEKDLDMLEDVGLKSCAGNVVQNPGMAGLKAGWLDNYSRFLLSNYVKPPLEAANVLRAAANLPTVARADLEKKEAQGDFAPRLLPSDVLAISFTAKQGAHSVELQAAITAQPPAAATSCKPIDWSAIKTPDASLANQRIELRAGLGGALNNPTLADCPPETHFFFQLYEPRADNSPFFVTAPRWTLTQRQYDAADKSNNEREVEQTYFIRGIYRTDTTSTRQKVSIIVEAIVPAPLLAQTRTRPQGRDWFVKAGASGGDGTREKPFRDPFQALDKAEGGDAIHVTAGEYFGKLRSGQWKILVRNLSLLGGYNAEFNERDPWKNPTRLLLHEEERAKKTRKGTILCSEENSEGLILDGFIFDGTTYNSYTEKGSLDPETSPTEPMVSVRGAVSPITIRNCLFINSGSEAIDISCPFGVFENNVLLNSSRWALKLNAGGTGPWIIRNNTFLFATDPTTRAGTGKSAPDGTLVVFTGRAETHIESNIFAFADNYGVRFSIAQPIASYDNNVFAGNLYNHLTDTQYLWADSSTWQRRAVADSEFASFKGNTLELPTLPVDPGFADKALARLFMLPSRISTDEWKRLATRIGSSAQPAAPETESAAAPAATEPLPVAKPAGGASSLSDLLANLNSLNAKIAQVETPKTVEKVEPVYCPVFDWQKALALFQEGTTGPGAHKEKISVAFSAVAAKADVQYKEVTPQQMDQGLAPFDNQPVQLEVGSLRESSTNPGMYPAGMTKDDYSAYFVSESGDNVRTRISLLVKQDTAPTKLFNRLSPVDKLRVKGTARVIRDPGMVAIIVDNAELAEPTSN